MTPAGRTIIAVTALVASAVLIALGTLTSNGGAATTAGASMITLVLGYVFGDRNGEKRLAAALTVAQAQPNIAAQTAAAIAAPRAADPTPAEQPPPAAPKKRGRKAAS